ncbi:hypothetical protein CDAR_504451 [Caerostris darwini]|uniref:Uncharacterized protein n=1 Tax=Caerostris darwini TaxID=1538125 RepID=A0AAV4S061_9ARAC|nr:hypothetical protein CDAR_504451 [Caerostris darwini]
MGLIELDRKRNESIQPIDRASVTPGARIARKKAKSEEAEEYVRAEGILHGAGIAELLRCTMRFGFNGTFYEICGCLTGP